MSIARFIAKQFWYVVFENMWLGRKNGPRIAMALFIFVMIAHSWLASSGMFRPFMVGFTSFGFLIAMPAIFYLIDKERGTDLDQRRHRK